MLFIKLLRVHLYMVQGLDYIGWTRPKQVTSACPTISSLTPQPTVGTGDLTPAGKRPGRKAGHWPTSTGVLIIP